MPKKTDYRSRIYDSYHSTHWQFNHSDNVKEYELYAGSAGKNCRRLLPQDKNAKIVDIACGGGHFLYFLRRAGYTNVCGIDLSPEMVSFCKKMDIPGVSQGDVFSFLPKHRNTFDMIVGNDVIEHMNKDEVLRFLDAAYAALKPGGRLLVSTPNMHRPFGTYVRYIDMTHEVGFTSMSLAQIFRVAGFQGIRIVGIKPAVHDFRSAVRAALWDVLDKVFRFYMIIERGTGRGFKKYRDIFEPSMFAAGDKTHTGKKKK